MSENDEDTVSLGSEDDDAMLGMFVPGKYGMEGHAVTCHTYRPKLVLETSPRSPLKSNAVSLFSPPSELFS